MAMPIPYSSAWMKVFSRLSRPIESSTVQGGRALPRNADFVPELPAMLPRLWAFALRIAGDARDAEEVVQRACTHAIERAHAMKTPAAPLNHMFAILYATWVHEVRSPYGRDPHDPSRSDARRMSAKAMRGAASNACGKLDSHARIVDATCRLPEPLRVVLLLIAVEGLTHEETAQVLGASVETVKRRLAQARLEIGRRALHG